MEVGSFRLFQPDSFIDSIKIKTKDGFLCRIFPIELLEFLLEMVSLSLISSAGKTSCIPVIVPVLT